MYFHWEVASPVGGGYEATRRILGQRSRKSYSLGDRVRVLVDRIDPVEKKIQFAVVEEERVGAKRRRR